MRKYVSVVLLLALGFILSSCRQEEKMPAQVLVIHTYDRDFGSYPEFDGALARGFESQGIDADIRNIYLSADAFDHLGREEVAQSFSQWGNWKPDIIVLDDDVALSAIMPYSGAPYFNIREMPVVVASMMAPEWDVIRSIPNILAVPDKPAFSTNIRLASELSGSNIVAVELDYYWTDNLLRRILRTSIRHDDFIDNSMFQYADISEDVDIDVPEGKIMVITVSAQQPEHNNPVGKRDNRSGSRSLGIILSHCDEYACLAAKCDLYGFELVDHATLPQFISTPAGFGGGTHLFLAGFFASYETRALSASRYAAMILKGMDPAEIDPEPLEKKYYMDYHSMQVYGLSYADYSDRFVIVGAPWIVAHPKLFALLSAASGILAVLLIFLVVFFIESLREKARRDYYGKLSEEQRKNAIALAGSSSQIITRDEDLLKIKSWMHPDHMDEFNRLELALMAREDFIRQHLYLSKDGGKTYRWWIFKLGSRNLKFSADRPVGILIDVEENVRLREELSRVQKIVEDTTSRENFIMNISHELRTPLNAIVGFAQVLDSMGGELSAAEKHQMARYIDENSRTLINLVNGILQFSRLESGRVSIIREAIDISSYIRDFYENAKTVYVGNDVEFVLEDGGMGVYSSLDRMRLDESLNQIISNAFKFTEKGRVTLGWAFDDSSEEVSIFVEDTGCGIPEDQQSFVYDIFWKGNEFVVGVGLGLSIAKAYTELMDGRIAFSSVKDKGTRVEIRFKAWTE